MTSARYAFVRSLPPKTATCSQCKHKRNRLSVYQGACYACLHGLPVAVAVAGCEATCARLPRHHGACRSTLRKVAA